MPDIEEIKRLTADIPHVVLRPKETHRGDDIDILCLYPYEFIRRLLVPSVWEKAQTRVRKEGEHIHLDFLDKDGLVLRLDFVRDFKEFETFLLEKKDPLRADLVVKLMEWAMKDKKQHLEYVKNELNRIQ